MKMDQIIDERKKLVLRLVVEDYVATATPVGSRTIAKKYRLGVSPATIRNEMADLEEMGFLEQPHTSAGRIPSDKGYRFYVDGLMTVGALDPDDVRRIEAAFSNKVSQISSLIQETVKVLSQTTEYLALVIGPGVAGNKLVKLSMVRLSSRSAAMVLVTDTGYVASRMLEVSEDMSDGEIDAISAVFDERLKNVPLDRIAGAGVRDLRSEIPRHKSFVEQVLDVIYEVFKREEEEGVFVGGRTYILQHPEFQDVSRARAILEAIEDAGLLYAALSRDRADMAVTIGEENPGGGMQDCSVVSVGYAISDGRIGRLGVIGPKRMNYARTVTAVELVGRAFGEAIARAVGG